MPDQPLVRNSRLLGLFVEIVRGPEGTLRAVETAGRGITAEARCTLAVAADKMTTNSGSPAEARQRNLACADRLVELGAIEDDLSELWSRRREGDLDEAAFEASLLRIVMRLEAWPQSWPLLSA
ncbi:hypothetical protein M8C11_20245 [Micromonospora sp. CPM1]|uniref:hypothetical protein n=1 Tax=Micromonospora sp. CPM1 TaxID=2944809 RepID=UPI00207CE148|nr:hypothetical protein [Micromonospora sp. CPM1]MCO1617050.1 hypothetical protein [Micromonospora sp. CPM1]